MSVQVPRRQFLAGAAGVAAAGAMAQLPGHKSLLTPKALPDVSPARSAGNQTLVVCTLYGGNDGLNTVVPLDDPAYIAQRGNIAIAPDKLLSLGEGFGLNPALTGFKALWGAGQLAIIRGVGYPDPNLSHFQSMDIWQSGSTRNDASSGWLGRWLDRTKNDPLQAFSIGATVLPAMAGERRKASALQDSDWGGAQLPNGDPSVLAAYRILQRPTPGHNSLQLGVERSGTNMLEVSRTVANALNREPAPTYPPKVDAGDIGTQLGIVSQLIRADLPTSVYAATQGNYDTHAGEVSTQTENLGQLDAAVSAFFASIKASPRAAGTVLFIYTEFGRRVQSNASGGTDHGAANDCFVIGQPVRGGLYGEPPSLTNLDVNGNLVHNVDFRSVYATLLERSIGFESRAVLGGTFPSLNFM